MVGKVVCRRTVVVDMLAGAQVTHLVQLELGGAQRGIVREDGRKAVPQIVLA
jgi:hypothetical protein